MKTLVLATLLAVLTPVTAIAQEGSDAVPGWVKGRARDAGPSLEWDKLDADALKKAAAVKKPIIALFQKKDTDAASYFQGDAYIALKKKALFVCLPYSETREPASTPQPACGLLHENPSLAYKIKIGEEAVLVLDCHGNYEEVGFKYVHKPKAGEIEAAINRVGEKAAALEAKMEKLLASANKHIDAAEREAAFKDARKVIEFDVIGYSACEEAALICRVVCDDVMEEVADLAVSDAADIEEKLNALAKVYSEKRAPEVNKKIRDTLKVLRK